MNKLNLYTGYVHTTYVNYLIIVCIKFYIFSNTYSVYLMLTLSLQFII